MKAENSNLFWLIIDGWGHRLISALSYSHKVFLMIYLSARAALYDQSQGARTVLSVVSAQIYFTGFQALPLMTVLALASGGVVIMQSSAQLSLVGGGEMIGNLLVAIIVREISPLMTALVVIARSGTAVASEIGNMRVNREIEALESMGINPLSYIVFPRLLGGVVSVVCLAVYFTMAALGGGFLLSKLVSSMSFDFYITSVAQAFQHEDLSLFLLKNIFSGLIIFIVCCYQGFLVKAGSHEVPQVTTKAVVNSIIYVVVFNLIVTTLFYVNRLTQLGVL